MSCCQVLFLLLDLQAAMVTEIDAWMTMIYAIMTTSSTARPAPWHTTPVPGIRSFAFCLTCRTGVPWTQLLWTTHSKGYLFPWLALLHVEYQFKTQYRRAPSSPSHPPEN